MRHSGILLPISSLPSPYGIGTFGKAAYQFIDFLRESGQHYWQILPLGPTGYGDSPYQSFSTFAGNPYFVDLSLLVEEELLTEAECNACNFGNDASRVDYGLLYKNRISLLHKAFARFVPGEEYFRFTEENRNWVFDYGLFMALKERYGAAPLTLWPEGVRRREPAVLEPLRAQMLSQTVLHVFIQYLFYRQWAALKTYANESGIRLIGDIPIYVSPDSADVWAEPDNYQLDENLKPRFVAGCPPDAFSAEGQLWGNPLYCWDKMAQDGFSWWMKRMRFTARLYDVVRIDHFRGFESYYAIPAGDKTAVNGHWEKGPGHAFIDALRRDLPGFPIIAEDLGYLTPEVKELLSYSGFPGMKVLQFAFDGSHNSDYLLHNCGRHSVMYTGTHDNTTTADWLHTAPAHEASFAMQYLDAQEHNFTERFVRAALMSRCNTCIIPIQDYLELSGEARINTPATPSGNWVWRLKEEQLTEELKEKIKTMCAIYARW